MIHRLDPAQPRGLPQISADGTQMGARGTSGLRVGVWGGRSKGEGAGGRRDERAALAGTPVVGPLDEHQAGGILSVRQPQTAES